MKNNNKLSIEEQIYIADLLKDMLTSYDIKPKEVTDEDWMTGEFQERLELPEKNARIESQALLRELKYNEEAKESLANSHAKGESTESWLGKVLTKAAVNSNAHTNNAYFGRIDAAVDKANVDMFNTIHTQAGDINRNPHLHGLIFEQHHAGTFNMNAAANNCPYSASREGSNGRNSVDIAITREGSGSHVHRYQAKDCRSAQETEASFTKDDRQYNGQQSLVPSDQQEQIGRKTVDHISSDDGTHSNPMSSDESRELQRMAHQDGESREYDYNDIDSKFIIKNIAKSAGAAAVFSALMSAGSEVVIKLFKGEKIDTCEVAKKAFVAGVDSGAKVAATAALKVAVGKGAIKCLAKGTPAGVIATIAVTGIDTCKVLYKAAIGEISANEALNEIRDNTCSTIGGMALAAKGAAFGASLGTALGPIGTAVGGFVGGTVGYLAGSTVGKAVSIGARKVGEAVGKIFKTAANKVASGAKSVARGIGQLFVQ